MQTTHKKLLYYKRYFIYGTLFIVIISLLILLLLSLLRRNSIDNIIFSKLNDDHYKLFQKEKLYADIHGTYSSLFKHIYRYDYVNYNDQDIQHNGLAALIARKKDASMTFQNQENTLSVMFANKDMNIIQIDIEIDQMHPPGITQYGSSVTIVRVYAISYGF